MVYLCNNFQASQVVNARLAQQFQELVKKMEDQEIHSFDDLLRLDKKNADALIQLAKQVTPFEMDGINVAIFGIMSTGKSTIINKLLGKDVAAVGIGETTKEIQPYDGIGYRLFDIPGRNDDIQYFSADYISFWKGLTYRLVTITHTIKEMTKVFKLLDAINLNYDIVVNKFDQVDPEEADPFKQQLRQEIKDAGLQGVNRIFFVSARNPRQFPDWLAMCDYITGTMSAEPSETTVFAALKMGMLNPQK
jgi:GTP-binding protein EngB required for normal cell division